LLRNLEYLEKKYQDTSKKKSKELVGSAQDGIFYRKSEVSTTEAMSGTEVNLGVDALQVSCLRAK